MADDYATNLLRGVLACLQLKAQMMAAQQMFQRGYFALSQTEKIAVDQAVTGHMANNYQALTAEYFVGKAQATGVGFLAGMAAAQAEPEKT